LWQIVSASALAIKGTTVDAAPPASWLTPTSGAWTDASRWSTTPYYPGNPDVGPYEVHIDVTGAPYTIELPSAQIITVSSLSMTSPDATLYQPGSTLVMGNNSTIAGSTLQVNGTVIQNGMFTNSGSIQVSGGTLDMRGAGSNSGSIAIAAGLCNLPAGLTNTGTIALAGGRVNLVGFNPAAIGTFTRTGGTVTLKGALINSSSTADINSAVGPWAMAEGARISNATVVAPAPATALHAMEGGSIFTSATINTDVVVDAGATLALTGACTNNGTISSTGGTVQLGGTPVIGNISLTNATLASGNATTAQLRQVQRTNSQVTGTVNNTGDIIYVDDPAGRWNPGHVIGGRITTHDPGGEDLATSEFDAVTLASDFRATRELDVGNGLTLDHCDLALNYGMLTFFNSQTLAGVGTVTMNKRGVSSSGGTLTVAPGITIRDGELGWQIGGTVINQGTVSARTPNRQTGISDSFTNQGIVEARNGATLSMTNASLTNYSPTSHTLTGGTYAVYTDSVLSFVIFNTITNNAANVILSGSTSTFSAIDALSINSGTLTLSGGRDFKTAGALTNQGQLNIRAGSDLSAKGTFTCSSSGSALFFELSGTDPESYGQITATSQANLAGGLFVDTTNYLAQRGDIFTLISAPSLNGSFSNASFATLPFGLSFEISYTPTQAVLAVVPEPACVAAICVLPMLTLRRMKQRK
jgi:hypothetical protein